MKEAQAQVKEFMLKAEQDCPTEPIIPQLNVRLLRVRLLVEELIEFARANGININVQTNDHTQDKVELTTSYFPPDITEIYDAIIDLQVVTIGAAVACGLEIQPGWDEVHRSNMSKFIDGYKREDGKWMKGKSFVPPNLARIIFRLKHGFDECIYCGKPNNVCKC